MKRMQRIHWLVVGLLLAWAPGMPARTDPATQFLSARDPSTLREAAIHLGRALNEGCCFGREHEVAEKVAEWLAACPRDPALVSALAAAVAPISTAVAIQDQALARRLFVQIPLACLESDPEPWDAYAGLVLDSGASLQPYAPDARTHAVQALFRLARGHPERLFRILERFRLEAGSLPALTLDDRDVNALIDGAGNRIGDLPDFFSRLPGATGTEALLRLAERRDLVVPPELGQWVDAGSVRAMAIRKLEPRKLDEKMLDRVARLAEDSDYKVADAARRLLDVEYAEPAYLADGTDEHDPERLVRELESGQDPERTRAASFLAGYLLANPRDANARRALRAAAERDANPLVRAHAWRALLATNDPKFTWWRLIERLDALQTRRQVLETLKMFDMPVPSRLLEDLPDALLDRLLTLAEKERDTRLRLEALQVARRLGEWAFDLLSRGYTPDEIDRRKTDVSRSRNFLSRFVAMTEPRVRALLQDQDAGVRREVAYWFAAVPARDPATAEALLAALDDPNEYVRDNAAMALAAVRAAPPGFAARLKARAARGDPDSNVERKLVAAQSTAFCMDPQAIDRLAAVILHRAGDRNLRRALAKRCRLEDRAARALLAHLDGDLVKTLVASRFWSIAEMLRAEKDPEPWELVRRIVPARLRDAWLLEKAKAPGLAWSKRMRLLRRIEDHQAPEMREALRALLVQGVREEAIRPEDFLSVFAPRLGYEAIRTLADAFARDGNGLERVTRLVEVARYRADLCMAGGSSCGSVPEPGANDLPWIARQIRAAAGDVRRIGLLVRLLDLYALGQNRDLAKKAWELGITPLLLKAMQRPGGCKAVRPAIHSLLGRMIPPRCSGS